MVDAYEQHDRPNLLDMPDDVEHGLPGHYGLRCLACALASGRDVSIEVDTGDYWQTKQIRWQEECDKIMVAFDKAVGEHFPQHQAANCQTCPVTSPLPPKPEPPWERRH